MWWPKPRSTVSRFAPLATALALAGLLGGCFEPLYGEKTLAGGPGLNQRLRSVAADPIRAASGTTFARVSYDNPGQQQRFANARGQRDAENRAAKVISDNIKARLASYFAAGT